MHIINHFKVGIFFISPLLFFTACEEYHPANSSETNMQAAIKLPPPVFRKGSYRYESQDYLAGKERRQITFNLIPLREIYHNVPSILNSLKTDEYLYKIDFLSTSNNSITAQYSNQISFYKMNNREYDPNKQYPLNRVQHYFENNKLHLTINRPDTTDSNQEKKLSHSTFEWNNSNRQLTETWNHYDELGEEIIFTEHFEYTYSQTAQTLPEDEIK